MYMYGNEKRIDILQFVEDNKEIEVLAGREFGFIQREKHKLEQLEEEYGKIIVFIPSNIVFISSEFFFAMFGDSVRKSGDKSSFYEKYVFECKESLKESIDQGITDLLGIIDGEYPPII